MMKGYGIDLAVGYRERLKGLFAFSRQYQRTLLLMPCRGVHTLGMHRSLDIAFLNKDLAVIKVYRDVSPGRFLFCRGSYGVLERYSNTDTWFEAGETLDIRGFSLN